MDSPSSVSTSTQRLGEPACEARGVASRSAISDRGVVIVGIGNPAAADLAAFLARDPSSPQPVMLVTDSSVPQPVQATCPHVSLEKAVLGQGVEHDLSNPANRLVLFLPSRLNAPDHDALGSILDRLLHEPIEVVILISSFRVHLGDAAATEAERQALARIEASPWKGRVEVLRPGFLLSPSAVATRWIKRLAPLYPLASRRLTSCFIEGEEFLAAIAASPSGRLPDEDAVFSPANSGIVTRNSSQGRAPGTRTRIQTWLGANRSWHDVLAMHAANSGRGSLVTFVATVLSWLGIGAIASGVLSLLARGTTRLRPLHVQTLKPRSIGELIALCHLGNIDRVRVVGYNNGVNHFGHRHPGRTIVSTVLCQRTSHAGAGTLKADCGTTVRRARDYLAERGEELYVVPNYSYVALGTAFFVPIHGSAVDASTLADTVDRVLLYDPDRDRIIRADRDDPAFRENIYNLRSRVVVLRLFFRTKPKSRYFVRSETWKNPSFEAVLAVLHDREATNVEIRQAHAASPHVIVNRYYTQAAGAHGSALESPRDSLGRLWDRLEENPISSFLMHALSRRLAWHTELFLTPSEFRAFWETRARVPLRKIQLRAIRRDGMPNSPFRDDDCVSADLFLFRLDKPAFDAYMSETLPAVRVNPGKHSN